MRPRSLRGIARLAPLPLGAALLWWVARQVPYPLLSGWIGMVGIVLVLHFGILEAFSLLWSTAGFNAPPLMDNPLRSAAVAEFWQQCAGTPHFMNWRGALFSSRCCAAPARLRR